MLLLALAGVRGCTFVQDWRASGRPQAFYQQYFEPAAMIACGFGFAEAAPFYSSAMDDFLHLRADSVDCESIPRHQAVGTSVPVQRAWFYLMWTVGLFWSVAGVSWSGLAPLFGALFAVVIGLVYAIMRLSVPPWIAWPASAALMVSTLHLQNLPHLRDYAKAPFVIGLILLLLCIVKWPTPKRVVVLSAIYGFVLGIGYGFRTDLLANIPPLFLTVLLFVPGFKWRDLSAKAAALAVAAVLFVATSWPATSYVVTRGGCQFHVILVGLEHNFTLDLGVTPSYYQWISRLSDEYIHTSVNSFIHRDGGSPTVDYCTPEYDAASGGYLAAIATGFPADVLTRAYASALRIIDLPFYLWTAVGIERSAMGQFLTNFAGSARAASVLAVLVLGAHSWRLGLFAVCMLAYFGGYPSLQFGPRHFFHLEFLGWWAMAFIAWQAWQVASPLVRRAGPPWPGLAAGSLRQGAQFAAVSLVLILAPLYLVRAQHDAGVRGLTQTLLEAPRVSVPLQPDAAGANLMLSPDGIPPSAGDQTATAYLDVRMDLAACPAGVPLRILYDESNPLNDYSATVQPQPYGSVPARILLPVFRGFTGLGLGGASPHCVAGVDRLASLSGLPLLPVLTLPDDWQSLPPHQRVGSLALRLGRYGR